MALPCAIRLKRGRSCSKETGRLNWTDQPARGVLAQCDSRRDFFHQHFALLAGVLPIDAFEDFAERH